MRTNINTNNILIFIGVMFIIIMFIFPISNNEHFSPIKDPYLETLLANRRESLNRYLNEDIKPEDTQSTVPQTVPQPTYSSTSTYSTVVPTKTETPQTLTDMRCKTKPKYNSIVKYDTNLCSKKCCNFYEWQKPYNLKEKGMTPEIESYIKDKYIGTNMSCNFGSGSGCLCVDKKQFNYLMTRGGNA